MIDSRTGEIIEFHPFKETIGVITTSERDFYYDNIECSASKKQMEELSKTNVNLIKIVFKDAYDLVEEKHIPISKGNQLEIQCYCRCIL